MMSAIFTRRFAGNYLSTLVVMGLAYWTLRDLSGFHRGMLQAQWQFGNLDIDFAITIHQLLSSLVAFYAVILIPYYVRYPWLHSKAFVFFQGLWFSLRRLRRPMSRARAARGAKLPFHLPLKAGLSPAAKQAGLALLLKFFFAPLMINWCLAHAADMTNSVVQLVEGDSDALTDRQLFDTWIFWAAFQAILFVDTFLFTIGYIIEVPALKNRIRSVDPTFFGWAICLACYPPFNDLTGRFFEWQSSDFPHFQSNAVHYAANLCLLTALGIYSWASVALGLKASNLTNRGIIAHGPYAYVRHPAYTAKNLAWWIGALPMLYTELASSDYKAFAYSLFALCAWTSIYALRGITEERHLLMGNNGYAEYMRRVKWRFIPRVI
jgi:protein-S-isoprenylcysteine O-methyltransferase Ste14